MTDSHSPAAHIFGQEQLDKAVALLKSPSQDGAAAHINAVVGTVDRDGVQVIASFGRGSPSQSWRLQAIARHNWKGDSKVEAKVILKW